MGRYKSSQSFMDVNTTKVKVEGLKPANDHYGPGGGEGEDGKNGDAKASGRQEGSLAPPKPEKIDRVVGSTAGAASSEFHLYRAARRREMTRIEQQEQEEQRKQEEEELASKVASNLLEANERTAKNAAQRKKRKLNARSAKDKQVNAAVKFSNEQGKVPISISLDDLSDDEANGAGDKDTVSSNNTEGTIAQLLQKDSEA